jgi:hypothetical protein
MRRHDQRDGVRRPRVLSQQDTRAASELLPEARPDAEPFEETPQMTCARNARKLRDALK